MTRAGWMLCLTGAFAGTALFAAGKDVGAVPAEQRGLSVSERYILADTPQEVKVSVKTPAGDALPAKRQYVLCATNGAVICRYAAGVTPKPTRLAVHVPAGAYQVCVFEGDKQRFAEPFFAFPATNRFLASDARPLICEPPQPKPKSDWARPWHDFKTGERLPAQLPYVQPRRVAFRYEAVAGKEKPLPESLSHWETSAEDLCTAIDRAAARLLQCGANLLILPALFQEHPKVLSIWSAKMKAEGLIVECEGPDRYASDLKESDAATLLVPTASATPALLPFAAAYRSLPPEPFSEMDRAGDVSLRGLIVNGLSWFYVVNTGAHAQTVVLSMPAGTREPARAARVGGWFFNRDVTVSLAPGEVRAFAADGEARAVFSKRK